MSRHNATVRARRRARRARPPLSSFSRLQLFSWVARAGLPCVASGDFHRLEHLHGWKRVVPCARDEEALIARLRSRRPVFITQVGAEAERAAA